jgi:hypothetical protein
MGNSDNTLFTARRRGERPVQKWVSYRESERLAALYRGQGWTVTVKPTEAFFAASTNPWG